MRRLFPIIVLATLLVALGWFGSREPANPLKAAELAYRQGEYTRAVQIYDALEPALSDPGHAAFNRAAALYELGTLERASSDFDSASRTGDTLRSARSHYDLGNCSLRQACQAEKAKRTKLLREAIASYDLCLAQSGGGDAKLLDDAWHNQELARRLLENPQGGQNQQLARKQPPPKDPDECEH